MKLSTDRLLVWWMIRAMMKTRLPLLGRIVIPAICVLFCTPALRAETVYYVGDHPGAIGGPFWDTNIALQEHIESLGHTVLVTDGVFGPTGGEAGFFDAELHGADVIVISGSISAGLAIGRGYETSTIPILHMENAAWITVGLSSADSTFPPRRIDNTATDVDIVLDSHAITSGFSNGPLTVLRGDITNTSHLLYATVGSDADILATIPAASGGLATDATVFVYDQGDKFADGQTAQATVVGMLPYYHTGSGDLFAELTLNGVQLFDQALEYLLPLEPPATVFTWGEDPRGLGSPSGDWSSPFNWDDNGSGPTFPNSNEHTAIFGSAIESAQTVFTNTPVTVESMQFDNTNTYIIAGAGNVTLAASGGGGIPSIEVAQGNHEIQVKLAIVDDTDITVTSGSLDLNNEIDLNGNTLTLTGAVNINHSTIDGGTVESLVGTLGTAGATSIGGDLTSTDTLSIDLGMSNTDFFDVSGSATLSGILDVVLEPSFTPTGSYTVLTAGTSLNAAGLALDASDSSTFGLLIQGNSLLLTTSVGGDADFDGDDDTDGQDFLIWQRGHGLTGQVDNSNGDANGDGTINGGDLTVWQGQYGTTPAVAASAAVPEPSTAILILLGGAVGLQLRKGRRSVVAI